jgi:hypothetical protein
MIVLSVFESESVGVASHSAVEYVLAIPVEVGCRDPCPHSESLQPKTINSISLSSMKWLDVLLLALSISI